MDGSVPAILKTVATLAKAGVEHYQKQREIQRSPAYRIVSRVRELLAAHDLSVQQLLAIAPSDWGWTLDSIANDQRLSQAITPERLVWIADQFGVRREWISGIDDQIYDLVWGYKQLDRLAQSLAEQNALVPGVRMTAFVDESNSIDSEDSGRKSVVLVVSAQNQISVESSVMALRHVVCGDDFAWSHWPTRRDVKAFTRWCLQEFTTFTRIVPVTTTELDQIRSGHRFPGPYIPAATSSNWQLEDYALTTDESVFAKEAHEVEQVISHMEHVLGNLDLSVERCPSSIIKRRDLVIG